MPPRSCSPDWRKGLPFPTRSPPKTRARVCFWPEGRAVLRDVLVPGDPDVTLHGLETLARELREGESFSDAVTAFCREVIDGAAVTP